MTTDNIETDKVKAALGVLNRCWINATDQKTCDEILEAISVLTEALAESRRDAALGREIATAFLPVMEAMRPLVLNLERLKDAQRLGRRQRNENQ